MKQSKKTQEESTTTQDLVDIDSTPFSAMDALEMLENPKLFRYFQQKCGEQFYQYFFLALMHEKFTSDQAKNIWSESSVHHLRLNELLQRDPGYLVALFDYINNFRESDIRPILIDVNQSNNILEKSTRDALTGLFHRSVFDQMLLLEFEEFKRRDENFIVIMIDIDDFKLVNDKWGHQKGDDVLEKLGKLINNTVRSMDIAARYGGEELVVLMPGASIKEGKQVADRIRQKIEELDFLDFHITASFGVSDSSYETADEVLKASDEALYKAKKRGKNRVVIAA